MLVLVIQDREGLSLDIDVAASHGGISLLLG